MKIKPSRGIKGLLMNKFQLILTVKNNEDAKHSQQQQVLAVAALGNP